jgi:PadR family transcriptional regulator, regulatory protein AphA
MSTDNLTTVSYVVLGCVAWRGPSTPYELNAYVDRVVKWVWDFNRSHLYSEPARLAQAGLLSEEREETGRRRRRYTITDEGMAALREWVGTPVEKEPEIRDPAILKLFFGRYASTAAIAELARQRADAHRRHLESVAEIMSAGESEAERLAFQRATGELGTRLHQVFAAFWDEIAAEPPRVDGRT